jgi:hypothetical protein
MQKNALKNGKEQKKILLFLKSRLLDGKCSILLIFKDLKYTFQLL